MSDAKNSCMTFDRAEEATCSNGPYSGLLAPRQSLMVLMQLVTASVCCLEHVAMLQLHRQMPHHGDCVSRSDEKRYQYFA